MSDFNTLDLESLDALLDAADVAPESVESNQARNNEAVSSEASLDASSRVIDDVAANQDSASSATPESQLPEGDALPVAASQDSELLAVAPPLSSKADLPLKSELNASSKPAKAASLNAGKSTEQWTDAQMDSLKKLIIIFGSVLIVLALTAIGLAAGGLFSTPKVNPSLMEQVEAIKNEVGQSYLLLEDSGKKTKTMTGQLSDVATQLAEVAEAIEILKAKIAAPQTAPVASTKPMTAAERKAALREEIQHNLASGDTDAEKSSESEATNTKVEKSVSSPQVDQLSADIADMKKRLMATQKVLENLQKQSENLQQQTQLVTDTLKTVETDVKALRPVAKVSSAPKAPVVRKLEEKEASHKAEVKPVKPADDPEWRARWSQQMGKSDGFP